MTQGRPTRVRGLLALGAGLILFGCAAVPEAGGRQSGAFDRPMSNRADSVEIPAGYGSLRVEEISISLVEGPLTIQITPLDEGVLRLLVPETHDRLSAIAASEPAGSDMSRFLVSFYTETQGLRFSQSELNLASQGRIHRPTRVQGITRGWGTGLLTQREPATAVYSFSSLDLEQDFTVEYRTVRSDAWAAILPRIQAERGRVRGRAGG